MRFIIGLIALAIFLVTASIDIDSTNSTLSLLVWGLIIIASLSVAGLTLTQNKES